MSVSSTSATSLQLAPLRSSGPSGSISSSCTSNSRASLSASASASAACRPHHAGSISPRSSPSPRPCDPFFSFNPPLPTGDLLHAGVVWKLVDGSRWKGRVYALTSDGTLHCFATPAGAVEAANGGNITARPSSRSSNASGSNSAGNSPRNRDPFLIDTVRADRGSISVHDCVVRNLDVGDVPPASDSSISLHPFTLLPAAQETGGTKGGNLGAGRCSFSSGSAAGQPRALVLSTATWSEREEWQAALGTFGDVPASRPISRPNAKASALLFGGSNTAKPRRKSCAASLGGSAAAASSSGGSASSPSSPTEEDGGGGASPRSAGVVGSSKAKGEKELSRLGVSRAAFSKFENVQKLYLKLGAFADGSDGPLSQRRGGHRLDESSAKTEPGSPLSAVQAARARAMRAGSVNMSVPLGTLSGGSSIHWCGWLSKLGGNGQGTFDRWQRRWFVLTTNGHLNYWHQPEAMGQGAAPSNKEKGSIDANGAIIRDLDVNEYGHAHTFTIQPLTPGSRRYVLYADSGEEHDRWIEALSQFGDGPRAVSLKPSQSAKAKDVLFGGSKQQGHIYDRLGMSRTELDRFSSAPKAALKLGLFDAKDAHSRAMQAAAASSSTPKEGYGSDGFIRYDAAGHVVAPASVVMVGMMAKEGGSIKTIRARFFVLTRSIPTSPTPAQLLYYVNDHEPHPRGCIDLSHGALIDVHNDLTNPSPQHRNAYTHAFTITPTPPGPDDFHGDIMRMAMEEKEEQKEISTNDQPAAAQAQASASSHIAASSSSSSSSSPNQPPRTYLIFAPNLQRRQEWLESIRSVLPDQKPPPSATATARPSASSRGSVYLVGAERTNELQMEEEQKQQDQ